MQDLKLTILSKFDIDGYKKLDVLQKYGIRAAITDLAILTGGYYSFNPCHYTYEEDGNLKGRAGWYATYSYYDSNSIWVIMSNGGINNQYIYERKNSIRPVLKLSNKMFSQISQRAEQGFACRHR